jgi:uncharacterized protein DUF1206
MPRMPEIQSSTAMARSTGQDFVNSRLFEILARVGFLARGAIYGIIGVLALEVATKHGGKLTSQQGALRTVAHQPLGHVLVILLAIGLGGYALWRLVRAALGRGPEGADRGIERLGALGSGLVYAALCWVAIKAASGSAGSSGNTKKTTAGVFDWPAGRWLVAIAGLVLIGVGLYQLVRGLTQKFLEDSKTEEMSPAVKQWITRIGTVGHVARAVIFGLVGIFLVKAAIDYKAKEAIGLDGALTKLVNTTYGPWLLGAVALGLIAFAVYSISDARYRRI